MKRILFIIFGMLILFPVTAIDIWQYPEMAERNSLFFNFSSPSVSFKEGFELLPPEMSIDYVLPFGLPFFTGAYLRAPDPNLKSFGLRAGYHINFDDPKTDFYLFYVFDMGFLRNDLLLEYNDEKQDINYYDFRFGVRRAFTNHLCISLESRFKLQGFTFGLSLKLL